MSTDPRPDAGHPAPFPDAGHPAPSPDTGPAASPPPPAGPGVVPPFAAPPSDRNTKGLWIGLGVGALVLVLCCVGGVAGLYFLGSTASRQLDAQARTVAAKYLDAWRDGDYRAAYDQLCAKTKSQFTRGQYVERLQSGPELRSYRITGVASTATPVVVDVDGVFDNGGRAVTMDLNRVSSGSTDLAVCAVH